MHRPELRRAPASQRLLSKPDAFLEAKIRRSPELWPRVDCLLDVIARRDGNPFALTRQTLKRHTRAQAAGEENRAPRSRA